MSQSTLKIAVCISGFLRTWEQTKDSFKNFFKNMDVDIYAQVYKQNYYECSSQKKDVIYTESKIREFFSGFNICDLIIEDVEELRQETRSHCEEFKNTNNYILPINESSDPNSKNVLLGERIYGQLRSVQVSADSMRKSGKQYDIVVKTRYDILYLSDPDWLSLLDGKIHCETGACGGYPCEIVVGGVPKAVIPILDRFSHLDLLFKTSENRGKSMNLGVSNCVCGKILPCCAMCSHSTFRHLLDYYNIEIGSPICQAIVMRSETLAHIPFRGTTPYNIEKKITE